MTGAGEELTERHKGTFWSDGNILCYDCGGGYMTVCLSKLKYIRLNSINKVGLKKKDSV